MRTAARLVGLVIAVVGLIGLLTPMSLLRTAGSWLSPFSLFLVAVLRVVAGGALLGAARGSRSPSFLRVFGGMLVLSGIVTALIDIGRARAMLEWATLQSPTTIRAGGVAALTVGIIVALASSPAHGARPDRP